MPHHSAALAPCSQPPRGHRLPLRPTLAGQTRPGAPQAPRAQPSRRPRPRLSPAPPARRPLPALRTAAPRHVPRARVPRARVTRARGSYQVGLVPVLLLVCSAGRLLLLFRLAVHLSSHAGAQERREASETLWAQAPGPPCRGAAGAPACPLHTEGPAGGWPWHGGGHQLYTDQCAWQTAIRKDQRTQHTRAQSAKPTRPRRGPRPRPQAAADAQTPSRRARAPSLWRQPPAGFSESPSSKEKHVAESLPSQNRGARAHRPYSQWP